MTLEFPAVSLARYAERIGYRGTAFFGIANPANEPYECRAVWTKAQRDMIAWALAEAQEEIEQVVGFPLSPRWIAGERLDYGRVLRARWGYVIEPGVMADTVLQAGAAVAPGTDPATVTVALGACAVADMHLFHAGTDQEILPSAVSVAGGNATFTIPWCRLVKPAYQDNPPDGLDYGDSATWLAATVDVRCLSTDPSTQASLIWRHNCDSQCAAAGCSDYRKTGCLYVRDSRLGILDVHQATYADGVWTASACGCYGKPRWVEVNYKAGMSPLTKQAEDAVIRLAHSKMPEEPCGCDVTQRMWKRDREEPAVYTRERLNCPFGTNAGAWMAWRFASAMRLVRGSVV